MVKNIKIDSLFDISKRSLNRLTNPSDKDAISTGYHRLDQFLGSLRPGNLIALSGLTTMGKSTFALNLIRNISINRQMPTLLFSAEKNNEDLANRLISMHCEIPHRQIDKANLSNEDFEKLKKKTTNFVNTPFYIENTHHLYIEDVEKVSKEAVDLYGIKLIVVDYLQMMYYKSNMNYSRDAELNNIICHLKSLAIELQVPIIVVSQLRNNETKDLCLDYKIPPLSVLRDSGTIGDDSDVVMFIHRPEYFHHFQDGQGNDIHGTTQLLIAKNRFGPTGTVSFHFDKECLLYTEETEKGNFYNSLDDGYEGLPF